MRAEERAQAAVEESLHSWFERSTPLVDCIAEAIRQAEQAARVKALEEAAAALEADYMTDSVQVVRALITSPVQKL